MRTLVILIVTLLTAVGTLVEPGSAQASHLPNKTVVLLGGFGRALGETHWEVLRQQFQMRGFSDANLLEYQYAGGSFSPDGTWNPNPGGVCESYSKASFLNFRQMMLDMTQVRADHEIFLVGYSLGGFVSTQALWYTMATPDDPAFQNLTGIISIDGPMSGIGHERAALEYARGGSKACVDQSMVAWIEEVGQTPNRYAVTEQRTSQALALGYKVGSFGNSVDCAYKYISREICPNAREAGFLLNALPDERPTMFAKNGSIYREYNIVDPQPDEFADNHRAVLISDAAMAELSEFVISQTR